MEVMQFVIWNFCIQKVYSTLGFYIYTECVPILNVSSTTGGWGIAWTGVG